MKKLIFYTLIMLISTRLFPQSAETDCKKLLMEYREKMKKIDRPKEGQVYHMDMNYDFIAADSLIPRKNMDIKYYMTNSVTYYKSEKVDLFSDNMDFIIATHPNRSILWNNSIEKDTTWKNINKIGFKIADSVLAMTKVTGCLVKDDRIQVNLSFQSDYQKKIKIRTVSYVFNRANRMLKKVIIDYTPGAKMIRSEITYNKLDFNYQGTEIKSAKALVFDSSNKLKKPYSGYKIIDNRSK